MNDNILSTSGKAFQKFISHLTQTLTKPKAKFISQFLCGVLFSTDLILTHVASVVPQAVRLTAVAKRFRRHLSDKWELLRTVLFNYLSLVKRRLDTNSSFIVDLTDVAVGVCSG